MHVCLVTAGEPLPRDRSDIRLHRTGQLAAWLANRGHRVDWVTNKFDHFRKFHRPGPRIQRITDTYRIHLLDSPGYRRNVSLARFWDHAVLGRDFRRRAGGFGHPDIVVAAMPTIELAYEAVRWAKAIGASSVLDIRDLWPDVLIESAPKPLRWGVRLAVSGLQKKLCEAHSIADAIVAPNDGFIEWGCRIGKRLRGTGDRVFPLGYSCRPIDLTEREAAQSFWLSKGVNCDDATLPILVFVGSLSRQFNFKPLLSLLYSSNTNRLRLVLCGTGDEQAALEQAARNTPGLVVPGWCSYSQMSLLMEKSIIGLMPYRDSPNFRTHIPNKAAEYLAHGLPVAWSLGTGPLGTLIETESLGVSYYDSSTVLARYVEALHKDPAKREIIRSMARKVFHHGFDAEVIHQRFEDLMFRLVAQNRTKNIARQ